MNYLYIEKNVRGGWIISDDAGHKHIYYQYSKADAIKKFRNEFGLKNKRLEIIEG